jgi:hypothetical protein
MQRPNSLLQFKFWSSDTARELTSMGIPEVGRSDSPVNSGKCLLRNTPQVWPAHIAPHIKYSNEVAQVVIPQSLTSFGMKICPFLPGTLLMPISGRG